MRDEVDFVVDRRQDPLERAVTRILKPSLDQGDHRLRNTATPCKLALGNALPKTRRADEGSGLHIWKSISSRKTCAHLIEEPEIRLDHARPGVRARDERRAGRAQTVAETRIADQQLADLGELRGVRGREAREELVAVLALDDAADVEQVRAVDAVLLTEALGVAIRGHIDADADDLVEDPLIAEAPPDHAALFLGVVCDRARRGEHRLVN